MKSKSAAKTTRVKSAERVLDIFELLAEEDKPMNLTEISKELDFPISSVYKIIQVLLHRGYLEADQNEKAFGIGNKFLQIGTKYVQNTDLTLEFYKIADRIINAVNESVFLGIRNGKNVQYIAERQSEHPMRMVSHLGMQLPLHATAMGKILLSGLNRDQLNEIYPNQELGRLTENTVTNYQELIKELQEVRQKKLAINDGESVEGIKCIAAPIFNSNKEIIASISVTIPTVRLTDDLWAKTVKLVQQGAEEISLKIFYK